MRIIGGKYRGKKLISPLSDKVRPTSDKAREALFNILRSRLGANFRNLKLLDLFAGSGAFALEAMSQGFLKVTMVDIDTSSLLKYVNLFALENCVSFLNSDALCLIEVKKDEDLTLPEAYQYIDEKRYGLAKVIIAKAI